MMFASPIIDRLAQICVARGVPTSDHDLATLLAQLSSDLVEIERSLDALDARLGGPHGGSARDLGGTPLYRAIRHLLAARGKRLRPICVLLGARAAGEAEASVTRELAAAVELVHNATLLHDDVVDLGDERRGRETSRRIFGNAASIFGGDWLLVEALERVRAAHVPGTLERLLAVLKEMLDAEALQLERRGRTSRGREDYAAIVRGKTASLFRWSVFAGGRAAGASDAQCAALEAYGDALGMAFQLVDDVLDITGDPALTGKVPLSDLAAGTITYPLVLALERDPELASLAEAAIAGGCVQALAAARERLPRVLAATGAIEDATELASQYTREAVEALSVLPSNDGRDALEAVAWSLTRREA